MLAIYSFTMGIFSVGFWPGLPEVGWLVLLFFLACLFFYFKYRVIAWLLWGMAYGGSWGYHALSHQLPEAINPSEFMVTGEVIGLPVSQHNRIRFLLKVIEAEPWGIDKNNIDVVRNQRSPIALRKLRLNWYNSPGQLAPGQIWRLRVKLRRPRGTVNQGGFDYQAWLMRQGISATGYVRDRNSEFIAEPRHVATKIRLMDHYRFALREAIQQLPIGGDSQSLIVALTVGDRAQISDSLWDLLTLSGVVHLMVISGLHVGLVAFFFYGLGAFVCRILVAVLPCHFGSGTAAGYVGSCCALVAAFGYAWLAGMTLPTQRALVMASVLILATLLDRKFGRAQGYGMALAIVAIIDPLAFMSAGFWLSFGAVGCLLWLVPISTRRSFTVRQASHSGPHTHLGSSLIALCIALYIATWDRLKTFARIQWVVFLALLLPLFFSQLPVAWLSPVVNLLAIPWVSFVIVPLCLSAALVFPINAEWAIELWQLADYQIDFFVHVLASVPRLDWLPRVVPLSDIVSVYAALVLVFLLLLAPRGIPGKLLAVPLLIGLMLRPESKAQPLTVSILDVGQGLSVVVRSSGDAGSYTLVYDTGPIYPSGFNAGDAIVTPYLRSLGVTDIDRLVVSHSDKDHSGGVNSLLTSFQPHQIFLGEMIDFAAPVNVLKVTGFNWKNTSDFERIASGSSVSFCESGYSWQWNDVSFQFLYPPKTVNIGVKSANVKSNNRSCVLKVDYADQSILLTGDIEASVERELLNHVTLTKPVTILVAPHHGSKTSSSNEFVHALHPEHVVFSAGYRHHFGHPAAQVVKRYQSEGSHVWNTAEQGAIEFQWDRRGNMVSSAWRLEHRRYWY